MFRGVSNVNIDAKGRVSIPSRFREQLINHCSGKVAVTIDIVLNPGERCLQIYPWPDWEDIEQEIKALPVFDRKSRQVQLLLLGHANEVRMDGSGRILLPPHLRAFAKLEKKGVLVGQGRTLDLWKESTWTSCRDAWLEDPAGLELPEELQSLSL